MRRIKFRIKKKKIVKMHTTNKFKLHVFLGFDKSKRNLEILYLVYIFLTWVSSKYIGVVEDGADLVGLVQTLLLSSVILVKKTNQKYLDLDTPGF